MGLTVSENGGGGDFELPAEGTHPARCIKLIDLGTQPGSQQFPKPKKKVLIVWELPNELIEVKGEKKPMIQMQRYTMSLHENAALRAHLQSWRGKKFSAEELAGFELKKILGAPCFLTITHSDNGKFANVDAVSALPRGTDIPPVSQPLVYYEIEDGESADFQNFSDKLKETIRQAPEWPGNLKSREETGHDENPFKDDDIPF